MDDEDSDLDLLVDPTERTTLFTLAGLEHEAQQLLRVHVSVLTPKDLPVKFRAEVLQQAQPRTKHPDRIEDYLQHIVEAIDHITGYVQEIDNAAAGTRS